MAEEVGFEPTVPSRVQRFSRPPPSATRPLLRTVGSRTYENLVPRSCRIRVAWGLAGNFQAPLNNTPFCLPSGRTPCINPSILECLPARGWRPLAPQDRLVQFVADNRLEVFLGSPDGCSREEKLGRLISNPLAPFRFGQLQAPLLNKAAPTAAGIDHALLLQFSEHLGHGFSGHTQVGGQLPDRGQACPRGGLSRVDVGKKHRGPWVWRPGAVSLRTLPRT